MAIVQSEAGTPSKLQLRQESQAIEGNDQQPPAPSQGRGWTPPNVQGLPGTASNSSDARWPAVPLGARSGLEMGLAPKQLCL